MPEYDVGDQLLETRVVLHRRPRAEGDVLRAEQLTQVAVDLARETLKVTQAVKELGGHNQYVFNNRLDRNIRQGSLPKIVSYGSMRFSSLRDGGLRISL
jgi:hypothetical protein